MESLKSYKTWICSICKHEVLSTEKPDPIKWSDGHVCNFEEEDEFDELGHNELMAGDSNFGR